MARMVKHVTHVWGQKVQDKTRKINYMNLLVNSAEGAAQKLPNAAKP